MKKTEPLLSRAFPCMTAAGKLMLHLAVLVALTCQTVLAVSEQDAMSPLVTLKFQDQRFEKVIDSIEVQSRVRSVYGSERVDVAQDVSVEVISSGLCSVMVEVLAPLFL